MKKIFTLFINWLWPIQCLGCHGDSSYLCPQCLKITKPQLKIITDLPESNYLDLVISCFNYRGTIIKQLIDGLKFKNLEILAPLIIELIIQNQELTSKLLSTPAVFCPIPLHRQRLRQRGFNQSQLLAQCLGQQLNIEVQELLKRKINTRHQVGLNKNARQKNIAGAFTLNEKLAHNKNASVVLVDDVVTTGSTANEAAKVLIQAGYKKVWLLAIAHE